MKQRIAILAALPSELKPLVARWKVQPRKASSVTMWKYTDAVGDEMIAVCAGMGSNAAIRAFQAAEEEGPLDLVLSVGLAGATESSLRLGEVSALNEVIDSSTGERFLLTEGERRLRIASTVGVADREEKKRLLATYAAVMVDMEAATVARLATMRKLPMCCVKAVSDDAHATLPDFNRFIGHNGQLRMSGFLAYVAFRPQFWPALIALGRVSSHASAALAGALEDFLQHKDWQYTNRTGQFKKETEI